MLLQLVAMQIPALVEPSTESITGLLSLRGGERFTLMPMPLAC